MTALLDYFCAFYFPALEIVYVDGSFFGAGEDVKYATDTGCGFEKWEEVEDEASAGMVF